MGVPGWQSRERAEHERFARALEPSPERRSGEFADELAVVGALRALGDTGSPDLETRQRIHAEIAGRLAATADAPGRRRVRLANLAAAAAAAFLTLAGLGLVLSKDALPGDTLYGVKRVGESASLGLAFGDRAKAEKHLEFAGHRVTEVGELAPATQAEVYRRTLGDFVTEVRAGVSGMTTVAIGDAGRQPLADLRMWARNQSSLLATQETRAPADALIAFTEARGVLDRVQQRSTDLVARLGCYQITTGSTDELGALPARGECSTLPVPPSGGGVVPSPGEPVTPPSTGTTTTPPAQLVVSPGSEPTSPTQPSSTPTHGTTPPPVYAPPIPTPTQPRLPTPTPPPPPRISLPPLLPGLPPIIVP
ncbi:DUF5667 domain-containing protein [Amycolatopsis sp. NPDC059027]|uniref:DUF5667 domain-containing protein n=1 Tax=Amycolatopsis sp. NPDC059027 TaxID=3346709 RepID=UPI00366FC5A2